MSVHDYASLPDFDSDLQELKKKFPNVEDDVRTALKKALSGKAPKYPIPMYPGLVKIRASSTDQRRGKSGGFRIVYHQGTSVCLVAVYAKTQRADLTRDEFKALLTKVVAQQKQK